MDSILIHGNDDLLGALQEAAQPTFVCTIASSDTGAIEGISIAGASADMRKYTPPADMEALFYGSARCIPGVAATPDGIPSPVIITMAALAATKLPVFVVDAGCEVPPQTPYFKLGGPPARSLVTGNAVDDVEGLYERGWHLGANLAKLTDYLILGESVPAGTTTALAVMLALGLDAEGKVSSTMIGGAHALKQAVVEQGFAAAGISKGSLAGDPLAAVRAVGDPMQAAVAGIASAASSVIPVMLAGGTQMAAVAAVMDRLGEADMSNVCVGTTRWILRDSDADMAFLAGQANCPRVYAADLDFSKARFQGMHIYEAGLVKEGVGAGGAALAALAYGGLSVDELLARIEAVYEATVLPMLRA
ncbi:MAG: TIGR00303 family protein [Thermoleophilia bacterium]|nr:TIGR00303 family protein [Thermoleophilia bacterium]